MTSTILLKGLLLSIVWELPPLLVSATGLVLLRRLRSDPLHRTVAWGLWIVLGSGILNWVWNTLLPLLFLNDIPYEYHDTLLTVVRAVNFGIVVLKAAGYGLLVRAVVLALLMLPAKQ